MELEFTSVFGVLSPALRQHLATHTSARTEFLVDTLDSDFLFAAVAGGLYLDIAGWTGAWVTQEGTVVAAGSFASTRIVTGVGHGVVVERRVRLAFTVAQIPGFAFGNRVQVAGRTAETEVVALLHTVVGVGEQCDACQVLQVEATLALPSFVEVHDLVETDHALQVVGAIFDIMLIANSV
eukprot:CAMPEP_0116899594 /NCGR_PEP_ID=MMETSP0467-20121206/8112_1 /TAXON_ID=283647 /ORGANISM="Mesodinium pulex, Strain SPMC105" /LENGTH=180 /DNA_ID=CAMNT_0004572469 /DNA_START=2035 /DNA_END=2578 /DNA_ORIENTATION=-